MHTNDIGRQSSRQQQTGRNRNRSEETTIRWAPGIRLQPAEVELLRTAFAISLHPRDSHPSIFVEREFRSGYSGALVLLVSTDSGQAPVVVKLAHPYDLQREYDAYHQFVEKSAPQNTARLQGPPILADNGQLGALMYTFAGGDPHLPTSDLKEYIESKGAEATVAMLNRLFRVYGRHWWAINRANKFVLGEHYDHLLPVHLEMSAIGDGEEDVTTLCAGEVSVVDVRNLKVGDHLRLRNFVIVKSRPEENTITLRAYPPDGEAAPPLRVRLLLNGKSQVDPGHHLADVCGRITATRHSLLAEAARGAMPQFLSEQDSLALNVNFDGDLCAELLSRVQLRNPLYRLDMLLDQVVEARFSTVHGDLNLNNVLIDAQTGFAWLIDFADTTVGPTLFDLQRLEVQIFIKLLAPQIAAVNIASPDLSSGEYGATSTAAILSALHADPPPSTSPVAVHQELYALLTGLRRLARQYLMDDLDWNEYYLGLTVAFVGSLKFEELEELSRVVALTAAATAKGLIGVALFPPLLPSHPPEVPDHPSAMPRPEQHHHEHLPSTTYPAPEPQAPPLISGFVGRDEELIYFSDKLKHERLAVVCGMAGVGKTALAATLARVEASSKKVFWHTFHDGSDFDAMLRKMAAFLAWHGKSELWYLLESARQTGGQPPSADTVLDYLLQLLMGESFLLCFDDFHFVEEDPTLNQLIMRLQSALDNQSLTIILTTRRMPEFVPIAAFAPLSGLSRTDTQRLLASTGLFLQQEEVDELHTLTAGNAQFLTLAVNILQQAGDPSLLIERLAATDDVERYLLSAVDGGLTGTERAVMGAISVLLNYDATRDAIEAVLNSGNIWRTLRLLNERHLVSAREVEEGREYRQHAIVQGFYYQELSRRQRRSMHYRAGDYYAEEEIDPLRSGIHYERAASYALAAKQATADVWWIINRGQARALRRLLEKFHNRHLEAEQWAEVNIAKGTNYAFLDERGQASESYHAALATLEGLAPSQRISELKARVCRSIGELLELENPEEALNWLERGLTQIGPNQSDESAALKIKKGTSQMYLAQYEDAKRTLEEGISELSGQPSQLRSLGLMNLGGVHFFTGDIQAALHYYESALSISQWLHDQFRTVNILSNIGIATYCNGDWQAAIEHFKEALAIAQSLGSEQLQAEVEINLGAAYINTGDDNTAEAHLESSLQIAQKNALQVVEAFALFRKADLQIRIGKWAAAAITLSYAERIAQEINHRSSLIAIYRAWSEIKLAQHDVESAQAYIDRSLALAQELNESLEEGSSMRVLGQVFSQQQRDQQALETYEMSLNLLIDEDPYEAARTMAALGVFLMEIDEEPRGREMIQQALATFHKLGAARDISALTHFKL